MLEGLREIQQSLEKQGITFVIQPISPEQGIQRLAKDACLLVVDRGYLRIQRQWRQVAAQQVRCPFLQVETDVIVPIDVVSQKEEYAAATIRPKILKHLETYLVPIEPDPLQKTCTAHHFNSLDLSDIPHLITKLQIDSTVKPSAIYHGGTSSALRFLRRFFTQKLPCFSELRNEPNKEYCSYLSPYLHFGHISPLTIALKMSDLFV